MRPSADSSSSDHSARIATIVRRAVLARRKVVEQRSGGAVRVLGGEADGLAGVYLDVFCGEAGGGAVVNVYEGRAPRWFDAEKSAAAILDALNAELPTSARIRGVYVKPFAKDRSRLGGVLPQVATRAAPSAGEGVPEALIIREHEWKLEVRLFDGLSTGLFLDQRENRALVYAWAKRRSDLATREGKPAPTLLNTFAYTCAFSVAAAVGGATTTSVDVSPRYLEWGKRNFAHNGLDPAAHRFARMDTFEFFDYAKRKGLRYDMIILDPPSFAAGNKRKGIRAWSSVDDYAKLVHEASQLLTPRPRGKPIVRSAVDALNAASQFPTMLASTNTQELCATMPQGGTRLQREVSKGLGHVPTWLAMPSPPADFAVEQGRFAACWFVA
jgi:23S rRNA (cytosine1962-C5)-methyltransferase